MFQSVRPNSPIYIFHKGDKRYVETGTAISQPVLRPKYSIPSSYGHPQEMVVDLVVKVDGQTMNFNNLPAQLDVSDSVSNGESIAISDSREAMNAEIINFKQRSVDVINSVDLHKQIAQDCDIILADFNPEFAEKKAQKEEMESLKAQVKEMSVAVNELMTTNRQLIQHLSLKTN
jgi:hypothetical protein